MKTIEVKLVQAKERQRKHFDETKLNDLADSIGRIGLLHAPVLEDGKLVCGERRLRAIDLLWTLGGELYYHKRTMGPTGLKRGEGKGT